jgi:hypothetical protein
MQISSCQRPLHQAERTMSNFFSDWKRWSTSERAVAIALAVVFVAIVALQVVPA